MWKNIIFAILIYAAANIQQDVKYLASITNKSVITCDEIIDGEAKSNDEETKAAPTTFNEKNITCKRQNLYILLAFLLITITFLIAVTVYCYVIRYRTKQKYSTATGFEAATT